LYLAQRGRLVAILRRVEPLHSRPHHVYGFRRRAQGSQQQSRQYSKLQPRIVTRAVSHKNLRRRWNGRFGANETQKKQKSGELHVNELEEKALTYRYIVVFHQTISRGDKGFVVRLLCERFALQIRLLSSVSLRILPFDTASTFPFRYRSTSLFRCSLAF